MNKLLLIVLLSIVCVANSYAENTYWLVYSLGKIKTSDTSSAKKLLLKVPNDSVIEIPEIWASSLCKMDKNILTQTDSAGRKVVVCVYLGSVRESVSIK